MLNAQYKISATCREACSDKNAVNIPCTENANVLHHRCDDEMFAVVHMKY